MLITEFGDPSSLAAQMHMARFAGVVLVDTPHHVTQRGNNQRDVFFSDEDRRMYLLLLKEYAARFALQIMGFCLMTNHVHFVCVPTRPDSLAKAFGRAHNDYARWLHIRRRESGHLWQNRSFSCPMDDAYCWAALAYIERNPVRAGLVREAQNSCWSSAKVHTTGEDCPDWLNVERWSSVWDPARWRTVLAEGLFEAELQGRMREATQTGRPLGSQYFMQDCEIRLARPLEKQKPGPKPKNYT